MAVSALIPSAIAIAGTFFPGLLGKIAGERAGEVAEKVVNTAAGIVGLPPDTDPQKMIEALRADAVAREKLHLAFAELERDEQIRIIEDRQDARESQERRGTRRGNIMLICVSLALFVCVAGVVIGKPWSEDGSLGEGELALVTTIAGALLKMLSDAFAFEFGSSRGSKEKDAQIADFKRALVQAGQERQETVREMIVAQRERVETAEKAVIQTAAAAASRPDPQPPSAAAPRKRNFVAQLVRGEV